MNLQCVHPVNIQNLATSDVQVVEFLSMLTIKKFYTTGL